MIASAAGDEIWREPDWPWLGKELHRRLARVARERYGEGLVAFDVDVPPDEYMRFDND